MPHLVRTNANVLSRTALVCPSVFPVTPDEALRLTPVPFDEWDTETRATLLSYLRRPDLYLSGQPDAPPMPVVMELFAQHVPLSRSFLEFMDVLAGAHATLNPALRELAVLRVAWRTRSGYEWGQHARMAAEAGLGSVQIEAVPIGPAAPLWSELERAVLSAADEMAERFVVDEATWRTLTDSLNEQQVFELLFAIGGYLCLAAVLNSIGLQGKLPDHPVSEA